MTCNYVIKKDNQYFREVGLCQNSGDSPFMSLSILRKLSECSDSSLHMSVIDTSSVLPEHNNLHN